MLASRLSRLGKDLTLCSRRGVFGSLAMSDGDVALEISMPLDFGGFLRKECPTCVCLLS